MISSKVVIVADPRQILTELSRRLQTQIVKRAIKEGAEPIRDYLRSNAPKETGTLRQSISIKTGGKRLDKVYGLVGPRRGFFRVFKGKRRRPTNYARLVDAGTRNFPGRFFFREAWSANADSYKDKVLEVIREGVLNALLK